MVAPQRVDREDEDRRGTGPGAGTAAARTALAAAPSGGEGEGEGGDGRDPDAKGRGRAHGGEGTPRHPSRSSFPLTIRARPTYSRTLLRPLNTTEEPPCSQALGPFRRPSRRGSCPFPSRFSSAAGRPSLPPTPRLPRAS